MATDTLPPDFPRPADHDARMTVAQDVAAWYLGDPLWAHEIIAAYLYPRTIADALDREKAS